MKAISLKATGMPSVSGIVRNIEAWIASKSVTLAVISAATCYAGTAVDSDPLMFAGAFAALGFVTLANSTQKGGEL